MVESVSLAIKDDKFNPEYLSQYNYIICFFRNSIEIGVIDSLDSRVLVLERYRIENKNRIENYIDEINKIFDNHYFLKAGYWKSINVILSNEKMTWLPKEIFVEPYAREYLKLNCELNFVYDKILWNQLEALNLVCIFSMHVKLYEWVTTIYQGKKIQFYHSSHIGILSCLGKMNFAPFLISLSLQDDLLQIIIFKNSKLFFCNLFKIKTADDIRYYIYAILQEFKIEVQQCNVELFYNSENENLVKHIYEIFPNATKGKKCETKTFGYIFDELQDNQFFNICYFPLAG